MAVASPSERIAGWGRHRWQPAEVLRPQAVEDVLVSCTGEEPFIARGLGRSYGDSSLANRVLSSRRLDYFVAFDRDTGIVTCGAGVSIDELLQLLVPAGWFVTVTPGTKFVTLGGAVASDVHGKNHHLDGCFSEQVLALKIATADGLQTCGPGQQAVLFDATRGGMGLTGVIVEVTLQCRPITSAFIEQRTQVTDNLEHTLALLDAEPQATYSVAWLDCIAHGASMGRGAVMTGEHAAQGALQCHGNKQLTLPMDLPSWALNSFSIKLFNALYYKAQQRKGLSQRVHYDSFFYPLDSINGWNRAYGAYGFLQYQFVIPYAAGLLGLQRLLKVITESKMGSFLSVLKRFGEANSGFLSFPMAGYTLALDFQYSASLYGVLDRLDAMVAEMGGRIYLTKDARMSATTLAKGHEQLDTFREFRQQSGAHSRFVSLQSQRLAL